MPQPLIVDLETTTPGPKPDMRVDTVTQVGWLPLDGDVAKWAECFCNLPDWDTLIGHHLMYDAGIMHRYKEPLSLAPCWLRGLKLHDTLALAYTQGKQDLSLKGLGASELGVVTVPYAQRHLIGDEQYLAQDLFLTRDLLKKLLPLNQGTAYDIDRALIPALIDCSYRGYEVDQDRLAGAIVKAELTRERMEMAFGRMTEGVEVLQSRRKKTTKAKGTEYVEKHGPPSIGSPTQLGRLFGSPDGDMLTDKDVLQAMANRGGDHGILADLILRWRRASKALTTYFYPLQGKDRKTGLFNITPNEDMEGGTGTGRLSSERTNMQNDPPAVQRCLRAPEGYLLRRGDYPQIELRCFRPGTRVLTADFNWDPVEKVKPGDYLISIEEEPSPKRHWVRTRVKAVASGRKQTVRITLTDGTAFECSPDHKWLVPWGRKQSSRNGKRWVPAENLRAGWSLLRIMRPWAAPSDSDDGYIAGMADGEGSVHNGRDAQLPIMISQTDNPAWDRLVKNLMDKGVSFYTRAQVDDRGYKTCNTAWVRGGIRGTWEFLGRFQPPRLVAKAKKLMETMQLGVVMGWESVRIRRVERLQAQEMLAVETESGTLLAEGYMSHNCAAEISDDPTMLAALGDPERDLHQETADRLFGGDRGRGKVFNFKELYIGGDAVKRAYPRFYEWAQEHWASVQRTSYSVSPEPFLHRRFIPLLAGSHARMAAINHPVQSMAVYITKVAMTKLFREGALLVNQVHDSIHDYVPADGDKDLQARNMAGIMESVMRGYLPRVGNVPVDVKISRYWSDE